MKDVVFITGNKNKAAYLSKYLGVAVAHKKVDLDELQSLDIKAVVRHKLQQAYATVQRPVLVEDVALEFVALGGLPGTFIRWFAQAMSYAELCALLDNKDRSAVARCMFGYYDGVVERYFEGSMLGTIADVPMGSGGYGWDQIFIPHGYEITRAQMNAVDDKKTYLQIKPFEQVRQFLLEQ